jgi:tetratricopeptide (TPR) repeat protein
MRILLFLGFLVLSMLVPVGLAQAQAQAPADLPRAETLIRSGRADEAWKLLSPHEFVQAGREDFDYLLGVAALDSGRADRATLIFERVLTVNPNHAAARLDMARAYFALGDFARARAEFESVLRFDPPKAARETIERYLAAIDERGREGKTRLAGYVEATLGSDSNVGSSTAQGSVFVPLFGVDFALAPSSIKARDDYLSVGAGAELLYDLGSGLKLVAGADFKQRSNFSLDALDSRYVDLRAGLQKDFGKDTLRVALGANRYDLDLASYRRIGSLNAEWRHHADELTQYSVFAQQSAIRYIRQETQTNSADQTLAGFGGVRALDAGGQYIGFASVFGGEEKAVQGRADGDKRFLGARAGLQKVLRQDADLFASLTLQDGRYQQENVLFVGRRREAQYDLSLGVNWRIDADWSLRPQVTYTRVDSNFSLYDYDRYETSITLRRDFR